MSVAAIKIYNLSVQSCCVRIVSADTLLIQDPCFGKMKFYMMMKNMLCLYRFIRRYSRGNPQITKKEYNLRRRTIWRNLPEMYDLSRNVRWRWKTTKDVTMSSYILPWLLATDVPSRRRIPTVLDLCISHYANGCENLLSNMPRWAYMFWTRH